MQYIETFDTAFHHTSNVQYLVIHEELSQESTMLAQNFLNGREVDLVVSDERGQQHRWTGHS